MEGTHSKTRGPKPAAITKSRLIVEVWNGLGCPEIGERELLEIQGKIREHFGPGGEQSPAAIARVLADEGAELRHPEVIECDAQWREAKIESANSRYKDLDQLLTGGPLKLTTVESLIERLEELRQSSAGTNAAQQVKEVAVSQRQSAERLAVEGKLDQAERAEQAEIAEWLKIWIQTPGLFPDWRDLRRRSAEFQKKFSI